MKLIKLIVLSAIGIASMGFAALPPAAQRAVELKAIIDSKDVQKAIDEEAKSSKLIDGLSTEQNDQYVVKSGPCTLQVTVVDKKLKPGEKLVIGPRRFELQVAEKLDCK